ncbi:MAG: hypothetical protein JRI23_27300 [Deltaproteobacteria bacterium]|jgi:hypothetical protein|nr:hypothetical protein [Deltaproteobacteria bacterium]MBW2535787.1 hypothetical protein [Deltaproteobacteria bacterium]
MFRSHRSRRRKSIDLRTRSTVEGELLPSSFDEVILLSAFVPLVGDGAFRACSRPFAASPPYKMNGMSAFVPRA